MSSNSTLLTTKFYVVRPRAVTIERPRLMRLLDRIPDRRLTLISATAGFGKTTLLASWLAATGTSAAWLSLDPEDNNPTRFLIYLIGALQTVEPTVGKGLESSLQGTQLPPVVSLLTPLINDLAEIEGEHLLVLEDYHQIENLTIHEGVQFLIEHLPPSVRLVITTRVDPPIPLSRMRVRGELLELRAHDLQFTHQEAAEFLSQRMGLQLNADQIATLTQRTEGWPAGLQMAALSLQGSDDISQRIESFTGLDRFVLDFLLEEVLATLPPERQKMMLNLSILNRFNGELCQALTGCRDGAGLLEELERENLFVIPLDNHRQWYRYHQLFADLLQHRLQMNAPETIRDLHRSASLWLDANDYLSEALEHASAADDIELLRQLLEKNWRGVIRTNSVGENQKYMADLADDVVLVSPRLMLLRGWDLFAVGRILDAGQLAEQAELLLQRTNDDPDREELLGLFAVMRALVASNTGDAAGTILHGERALEKVVDYPRDSPFYNWYSSRALVNSLIGIAHELQGEYSRAGSVFESVSATARVSGDSHALFISLMNEARICMKAGKLSRMAEIAHEMNELVDSRTSVLFPDARPLASYSLAVYYYEQYDLENARRELDAALAVSLPYLADQQIGLKKMLIDIYLHQGRSEEATRVLHEIEALSLEGHDPRLPAAVRLAGAKLALTYGDIERALTLTGEPSPEESGEGELLEPTTVALRGEILLAAGEIDRAVNLLERYYREMSGQHVPFLRHLVALVVYAVALERAGRHDDAIDVLVETLQLTASERIVRPFAQMGEKVAPLVDRYIRERRSSVPRDYIEMIAGACGVHKEVLSAHEERVGDQENAGDLTTRELEILQLMSLGYTNQKIADKLYVSINTVKTHASNLFDKLGASNRVDALVRAREARILQS